MKKIILRPFKAIFFVAWAIMPLFFSACSTAKKFENSTHYELRRGIAADTLTSKAKTDRLAVSSDSINTSDSVSVRVHNDTVFIERWHRYTRFKTIEQRAADTMYVEHVTRRDTTFAVADTRLQTIRSSPSGWRLISDMPIILLVVVSLFIFFSI